MLSVILLVNSGLLVTVWGAKVILGFSTMGGGAVFQLLFSRINHTLFSQMALQMLYNLKRHFTVYLADYFIPENI